VFDTTSSFLHISENVIVGSLVDPSRILGGLEIAGETKKESVVRVHSETSIFVKAAENGDLEKVKALLEEANGRGDKDFINNLNMVEFPKQATSHFLMVTNSTEPLLSWQPLGMVTKILFRFFSREELM
jgi:hypothetical protein